MLRPFCPAGSAALALLLRAAAGAGGQRGRGDLRHRGLRRERDGLGAWRGGRARLAAEELPDLRRPLELRPLLGRGALGMTGKSTSSFQASRPSSRP